MSTTLLEWRRRITDLYAEIRGAPSPADAHELWRATRDDLFAHHPDSPLSPAARASFAGLDVAPYDPAWRHEVELDTDVAPVHLEVVTGTDGILPLDRMGTLHVDGVGDLDVWWLGTYAGGVFVPMKDALAGRETYGGGRYVLDTAKGADLGGDGKWLVVDFNFAYNPSCAYDPAWACPLAPPGNVVARPIRAGELHR
ncbi:MAG: DUF1684 domain-containing protein, partial [Acidimicrobiales bacterium]